MHQHRYSTGLFPEDNPEFAYHVNSGPVRPEGTAEEEKKGNVYKPVFEFEDGRRITTRTSVHTINPPKPQEMNAVRFLRAR